MLTSYTSRLHGNWETCLDQIAASSELLKIWRQRSPGDVPEYVATLRQIPRTIDPELFNIMPRMDLQIISYLALNHVSDKYSPEMYQAPKIDWVPDHFDSVYDALPAASRLALVVMLNLRKCHQIKLQINVEFPQWLRQEAAELLEASEKWLQNFQPVWQQSALEKKQTHIGGYLFIL